MTIASQSDLILAQKNAQRKNFFKAGIAAKAAGASVSLWTAAGMPGPGAAPGSTNGAVPTDATAGAFSFTNPVSPAATYLTNFSLGATLMGTWELYDRLWANSGLLGNSAALQSFTQPALTRNTDGDGVELHVECYCVDPKTECMTKRLGWTTYDRLTEEDEILAFDPATKTTRWERPKEIFAKRYAGDMVALSNQGFEAFVTPNHRWPVEMHRGRARNKVMEVYETDDLPADHGAILLSAAHEAPVVPIYSDEFVRMVAWYVTEGNGFPDGKRVAIAQDPDHNPENVEEIRRDLAAMGARPATRENKAGRLPGYRSGFARRDGLWCRESTMGSGGVQFNLTGTHVDHLIECAPGKDKVPTMRFLTALTGEQLEMFVRTMHKGDGSKARNVFHQWHEGRMDAFTVAATLAGYSPSVTNGGHDCRIRGWNRGGTARAFLHRIRRRRFYYEGVVWCPVTEAGHWVARRNGKVFVTGNTALGATPATLTVTYTNSEGVSGRVGTAAIPATMVAGQMIQVNLQAGDRGVQSVQSCQLSVSTGTAGNFGLTLIKPYQEVGIVAANTLVVLGPDDTGFPDVPNDACLAFRLAMASATTAAPIEGSVYLGQQ